MGQSETWEKHVEALRSVEFAASLTPTCSSRILIQEIEKHPAVKSLVNALDASLVARLKGVVRGLVAFHMRQGQRFECSEFLMAVSVVMGHSPHQEARKFLSELASMKNTVEFSAPARVAEEILLALSRGSA